MADTKIEWAEKVWNPVVGCRKVSEGCRNCYAEKMAVRLASMGRPEYQGVVNDSGKWNGHVVCLPERLNDPLKWKKPKRIFVNSMSDLFHEDVPVEFIRAVFKSMWSADWHTYIILTKRPERMCNILREDFFETGNKIYGHCIWLGVSVSNQTDADKFIPWLLRTPAAVRFVSVEPMLEEVDFIRAVGEPDDEDWDVVNNIQAANGDDHEPEELIEECEAECDWINYGDELVTNPEYAEYHNWRQWRARLSKFERSIDWVICGGESGPGARPMRPDWVRSLRDQCDMAEVPFFFKQWGEWKQLTTPLVYGQNISGIKFLLPGGEYGNQLDWYEGRAVAMDRVGKKAAGNILDGQVWAQYPEVS